MFKISFNNAQHQIRNCRTEYGTEQLWMRQIEESDSFPLVQRWGVFYRPIPSHPLLINYSPVAVALSTHTCQVTVNYPCPVCDKSCGCRDVQFLRQPLLHVCQTARSLSWPSW